MCTRFSLISFLIFSTDASVHVHCSAFYFLQSVYPDIPSSLSSVCLAFWGPPAAGFPLPGRLPVAGSSLELTCRGWSSSKFIPGLTLPLKPSPKPPIPKAFSGTHLYGLPPSTSSVNPFP